ncbi:hypothetical protein C8F04DRAFT_1299035, partial [Mycena alexandri]
AVFFSPHLAQILTVCSRGPQVDIFWLHFSAARKSKRVSSAKSKSHIASLAAMDDRDSDDESEFPVAILPPEEDEDQDSSDDDDQVNFEAENGDQDEEEEIGGGQHCARTVPMLVPSPLVPGPKLDINSFCQNYNLDPKIAARFLQHKYRTTDSFWYIEVKELKELGFVAGEIAELSAAIAAWAT